MATKIRLQRHGRKGKPFFHIVVADSRARRDGRFIEKLGTYNPITNPATVELNVDSAVKWLMTGAEPTNTAKALLSYKGAYMKKHLLGGVAKGAFSQEEAETRFAAWLEAKDAKIQAKKDGLSSEATATKLAALEAEKAVNAARVKAAQEVEAAAQAEETTAEEAEGTTEEVATEE
ncbi:30S ribosomal protein S16 [Faecalibacter macacae]|uniref:Small ribosomal subunit protein bS16 n=1 Tax=Faecalibacter macacae TaxID=1859289 RepID=A0A3L9M0L4_9FLAO|nr:30S ribosomal protein S16 [Faecalibacter macacae]RLZ06438.1 30S ribosomal protein S16 [Faecalibacter macacae]